MAQFYGMYFEFDGKSSSNLDFMITENRHLELVIVNADGENSSMMGLQRSVEEEVTSAFAPSYTGLKSTSPEFTFQVAVVDSATYEAVAPTKEQMFMINKWLFQSEEYLPFRMFDNKNTPNEDNISKPYQDMYAYVIFTSGTRYNIVGGRGYFELSMRLDSPCFYSRSITNSVSSSTTTANTTVTTKFNIGKYAHPDVRFKLAGGGTIKIKNNSLPFVEEMEIKNVPANHWIYCYNEGFKHIIDETVPTNNIRANGSFNGVWLRLIDGDNNITITSTTGTIDVEIIYQNKIAIQ